MKLKAWLDSERGRYARLASLLGVTVGRVSQIARDGVPKAHLLAVRDFTGGEVSIEDMLEPALDCGGAELRLTPAEARQ